MVTDRSFARVVVAVVSAWAIVALALPANAQDEEGGLVAPSEFLTDVVENDDGAGGTAAQQVDSQEVQAQEVLEGDDVQGVSRFRQAQIEEIVVQARKRAELLEDTPVSVTALSENTLREAGITRLDQIQELVPNLQVMGGLSGQDVMITIRGIGNERADLAFDPGVGVYVDGVFLPRAQGAFLSILDLEQIEVLRGPQGTLFGKNTVGGAINLTTAKPSGDLEGFAMVRAGNYGSVVAQGILNVPVDVGWFEDKLFTRFSVGSENRRGYVDNVLRDEDWSDVNSITFLGSVRFLPVDDVTIDVSGTWSREHTYGTGGFCDYVNPDAGLTSSQLEAMCKESNDPFVSYADTKQLSDIESYGVWATAAWDLPDRWFFEDTTIKSMTSWREQVPRRVSDVDNTRIPAIDLQTAGGESFATNGDPGFARQISTELQVSGGITERFRYVGGYFVFWETATENLSTLVENPLNFATAPYPQTSQPNLDPPYCEEFFPSCLGRTTRRTTTIDNWTWAFFSQGTYSVTDWLQATAGVRYTEDKKGLDFAEYRFNTNPWDIPPEPAVPDNPGPSADDNNPQIITDSAIFSSWTPMASIDATIPDEFLDDTPIDHLMGYFTYSRGFKGGGFNALTGGNQYELRSFEPETLDNFEIGLKTVSFDQRLTMNLSLFMGAYKNIQVVGIRDVGTLLDPQVITDVLNAGQATTRGVEFELLTRPIEGMVVSGNIGYINAIYDEFPDSPDAYESNSYINRAGENFKNIPKFQSFISIQYSAPVDLAGPAWIQGWVTPRVEWAYTSAINFVGPEVPQARQPGWNLLNARLSYSFMDDNAEVALWGKNLLNVAYVQWMSPIVNTFGILGKYYSAPRMWGGELSYRF